ncbi:Glutamate 5-kinase [Rhodospirillaceae bacterium LM-1]|nr:Glutamate 5-kinase [Rhodospirillaceae bacterium LM-1]
MKANPLRQAKRVVVKIGSSLLVDESSGHVRRKWLETLADDIAVLRQRGADVIVVTSGAIAVGRRPLGLKPGPLRLDEKQAAAAAGQIRLAHAYQEALARHNIVAAQVLLTLEDSENRNRYLNARNTLITLLAQGAVPVINENDTVATQEIRFGDNDRLAARVAEMTGADVLVLFSDIDGLYTNDPRKNPDAEFLAEIREITPKIEAMAGSVGSSVGSGGMVTKLIAARIAMGAGCKMAIGLGDALNPLARLENGGRCTWFIPQSEPRQARKSWIAGALSVSGTLVLDDGAVTALSKGRSLLPAGVVKIDGQFQKGDCVAFADKAGRVLGRGLVAYGADEAKRIAGRKSGEIEAILGYRGKEELVHRDDLVVE